MGNTLFENALAPAISKVPSVMVRKPAVVLPWTVKAPVPGVKVSRLALEVPLSMVTPARL